MEAEELYEMLESIRLISKRFNGCYSLVQPFLAPEELEKFEQCSKLIKNTKHEYYDKCLEKNICPNCGSELETKGHHDWETGTTHYYHCKECQTDFD